MAIESVNKKLQLLIEIEKEGVDKYVYEEVNILPIIRAQLQFSLREKSRGFSNSQSEISDNFLSNLKGRVTSIVKFQKIKREIFDLDFSQSDMLMYSTGNAYYTDKISDKLYNRHLDPLYELCQESNISCTKFHLLKEEEVKNKMHPSQHYT